MTEIKFDNPFQKDLLVDVTFHDSNEEPEESCINNLVSIKAGDKIYYYFDTDVDSALSKFTSMIKAMSKVSPVNLPDVAYCVSTRFSSDFFIDWTAIERNYQHRHTAELE